MHYAAALKGGGAALPTPLAALLDERPLGYLPMPQIVGLSRVHVLVQYDQPPDTIAVSHGLVLENLSDTGGVKILAGPLRLEGGPQEVVFGQRRSLGPYGELQLVGPEDGRLLLRLFLFAGESAAAEGRELLAKKIADEPGAHSVKTVVPAPAAAGGKINPQGFTEKQREWALSLILQFPKADGGNHKERYAWLLEERRVPAECRALARGLRQKGREVQNIIANWFKPKTVLEAELKSALARHPEVVLQSKDFPTSIKKIIERL